MDKITIGLPQAAVEGTLGVVVKRTVKGEQDPQ